VPGHWEGDLLIGSDRRSAIGTLVERSTRYVMLLLHLPRGRRAELVRNALTKRIMDLPASLRHTITWDQGEAMGEHLRFSIDTGVQVYSCDPVSSHELDSPFLASMTHFGGVFSRA
jgi:transposase, IS30 family